MQLLWSKPVVMIFQSYLNKSKQYREREQWKPII